MRINYVQLRAFHAVATHGSFTAAGRALHVSQPTLSGQVRELEERFAVRLFERNSRGVVLTEMGRNLHNRSRQLFAVEQDIEQLLGSARSLDGGDLHVGADSPYLVTPLLADFSGSYPGVRLSLSFGNTQQLMRLLTEQKIDAAVLPVNRRDARLEVLALRPDQLVAFVSRGHHWSGRRDIRFRELADQRLVLREKGSTTRAIVERAARSHGIRMNNVIEVGSREGVREAVAEGLGIGIVPNTERGTDQRLHFLDFKEVSLENFESVACLRRNRDKSVVKAFFTTVLNSGLVDDGKSE